MNDLERVQHMRDCNWKPASQYWYELYTKNQEKLVLQAIEISNLKQKLKLLEK